MLEPNYNCEYCGVAGHKSPSRLKRSVKNFCSSQCSQKSRLKKIEVFCNCCGKNVLKSLNQIVNNKNLFCSSECRIKFKNKKVLVECLVCKKKFIKNQSEINRRPRHCCSTSCYNVLRKYYKDWGSNRSKLECFIEKCLCGVFPFTIIYNKTRIGYELDIHIPSLSLAFEFNGIFHKKAIYGIEKLLKVQQNDRDKAAECIIRDIKLIVYDVSEDKSTKKVMKERFEQVLSAINERILEMDYPTETRQFSVI